MPGGRLTSSSLAVTPSSWSLAATASHIQRQTSSIRMRQQIPSFSHHASQTGYRTPPVRTTPTRIHPERAPRREHSSSFRRSGCPQITHLTSREGSCSLRGGRAVLAQISRRPSSPGPGTGTRPWLDQRFSARGDSKRFRSNLEGLPWRWHLPTPVVTVTCGSPDIYGGARQMGAGRLPQRN